MFVKMKPRFVFGAPAAALLHAARSRSSDTVHVSLVNQGGLRVPLAAGPILMRHAYELLPFENFVVVLTLSGGQLEQLADQIARTTGEPIAGWTMELDGDDAVGVLVGGEPIDPDRTYRLATVDYLVVRVLDLGGVAGLAGVEPLWARIAHRARDSGENLSYGPLLHHGVRLVVLHTNDTHSRMDLFPMDGGRFQGLGGAARRATLIRRVREANEHVLLLDSGDIFQGTPYFNFFGGELEFRAMTAMGYDVATLGNHDFDNGVDGLVAMLPEAGFEFVSANYDVSDSALAGRVERYTVCEVRGREVWGSSGSGIAFEKLVLASLHEGVVYTDPVAAARTACRELRDQGCSLIICLSHLGYRYGDPARPSDLTLAAAGYDIDARLNG